MNSTKTTDGLYERIYHIVRQVPEGRVASYGQIARIAGSCSARQVGYAMAALSYDSDVPWHRIINSQGQISLRRNSDGHDYQRILLEDEGINFDERGRIDLKVYGWKE